MDDQRGPSPFGRGWIPAERDVGLPGEAETPPPVQRRGPGGGVGCDGGLLTPPPPTPSCEEEGAFQPFSVEPVLTPAIKLRFVDELSRHGNVRVAAARVGVSRSGVYLARRRDGAFDLAWRGALVLARRHVEAVLAERALDGVEEAVFYHGEQIATRRRFDTRLLLAHLARLDQLCEADGAAAAQAGAFDAALAALAGLPEAEPAPPAMPAPVDEPVDDPAEAAKQAQRDGQLRAWLEVWARDSAMLNAEQVAEALDPCADEPEDEPEGELEGELEDWPDPAQGEPDQAALWAAVDRAVLGYEVKSRAVSRRDRRACGGASSAGNGRAAPLAGAARRHSIHASGLCPQCPVVPPLDLPGKAPHSSGQNSKERQDGTGAEPIGARLDSAGDRRGERDGAGDGRSLCRRGRECGPDRPVGRSGGANRGGAARARAERAGLGA